MSLKKIALIIPFVIFAVVSIFMSCSSNEEPPVVFPPTDQLQVYYISSADADDIVIDGQMDEGIWQAATQSQLTTYDTSDYNPKAKIFLVKMSALCDSTYVYFSATWQDDTERNRYRQWVWDNDNIPWHQENTKEDNFAIFFETGAQASQGLNEIGPNCLSMCHEPLFMVNETGTPVDGWYWRAAITNPIASAIDLYFVDSLDTDSLNKGMDDEVTPGYERNYVEGNTSEPILYWTANPDTLEYTVIDTTYTDDTISSIDTIITFGWDHGDYLLAADTVEFTDNPDPDFVDSVFVPSFVIFEDRSGSRWDVEAKGTYFEGRWTVEFKRRMNTGNGDDVQFIIGDEIGIVIAVGDDVKQPHYGFEPILLKF